MTGRGGSARQGKGISKTKTCLWLSFRCTMWNGNGGWWKGWWGSVGVVVVVVCGILVRSTKRGEGVWVKNLKPSHRGLVSGVLCEMAIGDGGEGWWSGTVV